MQEVKSTHSPALSPRFITTTVDADTVTAISASIALNTDFYPIMGLLEMGVPVDFTANLPDGSVITMRGDTFLKQEVGDYTTYVITTAPHRLFNAYFVITVSDEYGSIGSQFKCNNGWYVEATVYNVTQ